MKKKKIILGLTGSVATVKIFKLIEEFERKEFEIKIIATGASWIFILSAIFRKIELAPKILKYWETGFWEILGAFSKRKGKVEHINLVKWADALVIAPASANTISKIANAFADNFLTTIVLAMPYGKRIFIAPAMNIEMWNNPFFQENMEKIRKRTDRYTVIEPATGRLRCGDIGIGKMAEAKEIAETVNNLFGED